MKKNIVYREWLFENSIGDYSQTYENVVKNCEKSIVKSFEVKKDEKVKNYKIKIKSSIILHYTIYYYFYDPSNGW